MGPSGTDWYYDTLRDLTIASTGVVVAAWTQWHNHGWLNQHGTISNFLHLTSPSENSMPDQFFNPSFFSILGSGCGAVGRYVWNLKSVVRIPPYRSNSQSCPSLQALPSGFEPSCSSIVPLNTLLVLNSVQLANSLLICSHWFTLLKKPKGFRREATSRNYLYGARHLHYLQCYPDFTLIILLL